MRNIIFHHHFFKNAGTSFDEVLASSYKDGWVEREFEPGQRLAHSLEVKEWIIAEDKCIAFSSHTALYPVEKIPGINITSFFFIRHPIARLKSVYDFEKKQEPRLTFGARLAEKSSFVEFIRGSLANSHDKQCRNFHCDKLAFGAHSDDDKFSKAIDVIESVPCFGIVKRFEESLQLLKCFHGGFLRNLIVSDIRRNSTNSMSEEESLIEIQSLLGGETYEELLSANSFDLMLYEIGLKKFDRLVNKNLKHC